MEHRIFQDAHRSVAVSVMRMKTGAAGGGMVVERVKEAVDLWLALRIMHLGRRPERHPPPEKFWRSWKLMRAKRERRTAATRR